MKYLVVIVLAGILFTLSFNRPPVVDSDSKVWEVLEMLGEDASKVKPDLSVPNVSAEIGYNLITQGFSDIPGQPKAKRQSKHFVCTSCHNIEREDPDLTVADPQARLDYVVSKGIPFLQGSALYGVSNREYFYNGDYDKKYGDLVKPAREDLRGAIRLCALECAQGRDLKGWEMESIVAYFWDIQLKMSDLNLTDSEMRFLEGSIADSLSWGMASSILRTKYLSYSPATFLLPPDDRTAGAGLTGDPDNGQKIYESSCLHCHENKRYSFMHLDNGDMSFKHLSGKIPSYKPHSLYLSDILYLNTIISYPSSETLLLKTCSEPSLFYDKV